MVDIDDYFDALQRLCNSTPDIELHVGPAPLLVIIGALQLALRHPDLPMTSEAICRQFIRQIRERIALIEPHIAEAIDLGAYPAGP